MVRRWFRILLISGVNWFHGLQGFESHFFVWIFDVFSCRPNLLHNRCWPPNRHRCVISFRTGNVTLIPAPIKIDSIKCVSSAEAMLSRTGCLRLPGVIITRIQVSPRNKGSPGSQKRRCLSGFAPFGSLEFPSRLLLPFHVFAASG